MRTHTDILRAASLLAAMFATSPGWAALNAEYTPERLGTRPFTHRDKEYRIPWYKVRADYNSIRTPDLWKRIRSPQETKAAYVGYYHEIRWCEWLDDRTRNRLVAQGVDFLWNSDFSVHPGPGSVYVRRWLFEEKGNAEAMAFKDKNYYVFLLDRQPVEQWRSLANKPGCDLDTELEHVIGIIEIEPTFEFDERSSSSPFYVSRDSLLVFRYERHGFSGYAQEYAVVRSKDGTLRSQAQGAETVPANPATVQKLLYALNTCEWRRRTEPHVFEIAPPVTRATLEYRDKLGQTRRVVISYDRGGWHTDRFESAYYFTTRPLLLFEVQEEIHAGREAGTEHSEPSEPNASERIE
jgi:hypothetical protein